MKKFVSLTMALCSVLSVGAMFAACGHDCEFATDWSKDATHHWHACVEADCEEVADKAEHTWNAGEVTTPATATTKGVKTYTCTACSQTKTEEFEAVTTVTAEQWAAAFNLGAKTCKMRADATMEMEMAGMTISVAMAMDFIVTDTAVYGKNVQSQTMGTETEEYVDEFYASKEGESYFYYEEETIEDAKVWVKTTSTAEDFADAKSEIDLTEAFPFAFANATYDATTKTYTVADIAGNPSEYEAAYNNIKAQFVDGNLVSLSFAMVQDGRALNYVITVSYDNVSVTLPANAINGDDQSQS